MSMSVELHMMASRLIRIVLLSRETEVTNLALPSIWNFRGHSGHLKSPFGRSKGTRGPPIGSELDGRGDDIDDANVLDIDSVTVDAGVVVCERAEVNMRFSLSSSNEELEDSDLGTKEMTRTSLSSATCWLASET